MEPALEELYLYWIGNPDPTKWPKHLQNSPLMGHGEYAFREGLLLGLV